MANPLQELIKLLDKSDDYMMELEKTMDPKVWKEVNRHLDEAYKALNAINKSANIKWADYQEAVNGG